MLDDAFISLLKTRTETASLPPREDLPYLIGVWDEVKSAPDVPLERYDRESFRILSEYINEALCDRYYDYREDPWYGYSASYSESREENTLRVRLLDSEDMAHDLRMLAEDIRESFGFSFSTPCGAEKMSTLLKTIALSDLLSPSLLDREALVGFLKGLEALEILSVDVRRARGRITKYYLEDVFNIDKRFWKGGIVKNSLEYREIKKRIESAKKTPGRLGEGEIEALSALFSSYRAARRNYRKKEAELSLSFSFYSGWKTDWKKVSEEGRILLGLVGTQSFGSLSSSSDWEGVRKKAYIYYTGLNTIYEKYNSSFSSLLSDWDTSVVDLRSASLSSLEERFHKAGMSSSLRYEWKNVEPVVRKAEENGIISFLNEVLTRHLSAFDIIASYRKALAKKAVTILYNESIELQKLMEEKEEEKKDGERNDDISFSLYMPLDLRAEAREYGVDSFSSPSYRDFIRAVVEAEAPLFERDLMKRLSFLGGEEYLTPETVESYRKAMGSIDGVSFAGREGFLYSTEKKDYPFRRASLMRDFSHIAPEELSSGLKAIIEKKGRIEKSQLYNILGSYCGYSVVLKSRYPELDRALMALGDSITLDGDIVRMRGEA